MNCDCNSNCIFLTVLFMRGFEIIVVKIFNHVNTMCRNLIFVIICIGMIMYFKMLYLTYTHFGLNYHTVFAIKFDTWVQYIS